ncbi:MAG: lysoplasmalogenase [Acidimicrobiia bacterium]|nr:lysoplasmalogenase [Acidimicrobiia bacterium]
MTTASWVFAVAALAFAVTDWWAVWVKRAKVRYVTKPAALGALIGVALTLDPAVDPTVRSWMVAGLVLSLVGDIFLMLDDKWFVAGLSSFLLGHIAYVVGLQLAPTSRTGTVVGLIVVGLVIATVGRRIVTGVASGDHRELVVPVVAYLVVISAMVVSASGTEDPWAVAGAGLFYVSDATLAWNRFLEPRRWGPLTVMVTYHLGQAGLVSWLVTG